MIKMFARISFDNGQNIILDELKQLEKFLSDEVKHSPKVKDEDGNIVDYWSYQHTYNPNDEALKNEKNPKKLVTQTDIVELDTSKEYLADVELLINKFPKLKIKIRGILQRNDISEYNNIVNQMLEIEKKFQNALSSFNEKVEFNQKCNVHIGNLGLLNINQLAYAEDKCTEQLQHELNAGWRIIAVCPQPDQRRPDYILGRYIPNDDSNTVDCIRM